MESSRINVKVMFNSLKRLFTVLPTSCFGEPLELGVLRIAEISSIIGLGGVFGFLVILIQGNVKIGISVIGLLLMAVLLVCSLLLMVGVINKRPELMKPWFWLMAVVGCLFLFLGFLMLILAPFLRRQIQLDIVISFASIVITCAVMRYCDQAVYALMTDHPTTSREVDSDSDEESAKGSSHESIKGSSREYDLSMNLERD